MLQLDDDSYLFSLAADEPRRARRRPRRQVVPASTARLVTSLPFPAFVEGRYLDVLAANPLAPALSPRLAVGGNRLRDLFLNPAEQALFRTGSAPRRSCSRASAERWAGTPTTHASSSSSGGLPVASPPFRAMWARHDVAERVGASLTFHHPQVGDLSLDREKHAGAGTDGLMLVIYHPQPGTDSADKLTLLALTMADQPPR